MFLVLLTLIRRPTFWAVSSILCRFSSTSGSQFSTREGQHLHHSQALLHFGQCLFHHSLSLPIRSWWQFRTVMETIRHLDERQLCRQRHPLPLLQIGLDIEAVIAVLDKVHNFYEKSIMLQYSVLAVSHSWIKSCSKVNKAETKISLVKQRFFLNLSQRKMLVGTTPDLPEFTLLFPQYLIKSFLASA